jgi:carbamoyltransferase
MNILGMFGPGPNPSSALLVNGKIAAFIEEERLNRIKTSPYTVPIQSAQHCLTKARLSLDDIDGIAYAWDCQRYALEAPLFFKELREKSGDTSIFNKLQEEMYINMFHPERIRHTIQLGLGHLSKNRKIPEITFYPHHLCHVASAFYCSGFEEACFLSFDGSGEETTSLLGTASLSSGLEIIKQFQLPDTLGGFYATFTEFMGFKPYQDEGKLMGLASYGKYDPNIEKKLDQFIPYNHANGDYKVNVKMRYAGKHTYGSRFTDEFVDLFGQPRPANVSALKNGYPDLAFAVQKRLEDIIITNAREMAKQTGLNCFTLAGGVAMNCVTNGKLASQNFVHKIFVQPAASDNGTSLGAALLLTKELGQSVNFKLTHLYYGNEYSNEEIKQAIIESKLSYRHSDNICEEVATHLAAGKIIGWFQGAMEVGARALGNRSILASPLISSMKDKLNLEVKHREDWRPFCPSMKIESYDKYIDHSAESPFMIMAFPVKKAVAHAIPAVVHVDGTARPQTVTKEDNPRFWHLLDEFEQITGHSILINTSFNIQGEPIVCSPRDALRTFGGTGIDILAMGDFILEKK